jgi:hypothetical protein
LPHGTTLAHSVCLFGWRVQMIAYLVMAHREPQILRRLVASLAAPWSRAYIHIDKKVDIAPFVAALSGSPNVAFIENRVPVHWGGWSQVQATINLIQAAASASHPFTRFALLSGDCYPVKDNLTIRDFLFADGNEYIDVVEMPNAVWDKPLSRLTRWHFEGGHRAAGFAAFCIRRVNELARFWPPRNLKAALEDHVPYAGNTWWILSRDAIEIILTAIAHKQRLVAFYRHSASPDESFFHTIIGNSSAASRVAAGLMFADWSNRQSGPCLINHGHLPGLLSSDVGRRRARGEQPALFARKFATENADLLDKIDAARAGW